MPSELDYGVFLFIGPVVLGAAVGFVLSLRKPKEQDLSWRREPTFTRDANYTLPETDHLGRREPTLRKDFDK